MWILCKSRVSVPLDFLIQIRSDETYRLRNWSFKNWWVKLLTFHWAWEKRKFRNLWQKRDGEPDAIELCKCSEDVHYSALQRITALQIIKRKWFNRFHSRDRQLCKFMGQERTWDCLTGITGISFYPTLISYPHIPWPSGFSCTVGSGYEIEIRIIFGHF